MLTYHQSEPLPVVRKRVGLRSEPYVSNGWLRNLPPANEMAYAVLHGIVPAATPYLQGYYVGLARQTEILSKRLEVPWRRFNSPTRLEPVMDHT